MLFRTLVLEIAAASATRTVAGDLHRAEAAAHAVAVVFASVYVASDTLIHLIHR